MDKRLKKKLPVPISAAVTMPTALTAAALWGIDVEKYNEEIKSYAVELGNDTDRFNFPNTKYKKFDDGISPVVNITEDDPNYIEFYKKCSNIEAVSNPLKQLKSCTASGLCLGISSLSILSHNGIISPSDIQTDKKNLIDIELGNDVMKPLVSYQSRQAKTDFKLFMNWSLSHYTDEERIDSLLNQAQKCSDNGEYFLIIITSNKSFNHALTGIGMLDGEFESDGEIYDKCILAYDSNSYYDDENGKMKQCYTTCHSCLFINSKTKKAYYPGYYDDTEEEIFSYLAISDFDFINSNGMYNPSYDYATDVTDLNSIEIKSDSSYDLLLKRSNGSEYDGVATSNRMLGKYEHGMYFCDGNEISIKNTESSDTFLANIINTKSYTASDFKGTVDNILKNDDYFRFDTKGETNYNVSLVFEENFYNFAPHFRYDFSGIADKDFSAKRTEKGIVLSSSTEIKCTLKTSDIKRDENNLLISAEDNLQNDAINTRESVMIGFDNNNKLKYYIGADYSIEVQKGDVNCDGVIDAVDASAILSSYADTSTGKTQYIGCTLGDYNNDGCVDAIDASAVLTEYAESSVIQ